MDMNIKIAGADLQQQLVQTNNYWEARVSNKHARTVSIASWDFDLSKLRVISCDDSCLRFH